MTLLDWLIEVDKLSQERVPFVSITLVDIKISAPQEIGARALVTKDGLFWGTVGGGKVEARAIDRAVEMLNGKKDSTCLLTWNLRQDVGMTCGGVVSLFFESFFVDSWDIVVFGAGHVCQSLVPILDTLACRVTVLDSRQEWLDKLAPSPKRVLLQSDNMAEEVQRFGSDSYFLCLTKGHSTDLPIVEKILRTRVPRYLGVIGSAAKAVVLKRSLAKLGIEPERLETIHCPIGLNIGSSRPAEIAVSIVAQLLQVRDHQMAMPG